MKNIAIRIMLVAIAAGLFALLFGLAPTAMRHEFMGCQHHAEAEQ